MSNTTKTLEVGGTSLILVPDNNGTGWVSKDAIARDHAKGMVAELRSKGYIADWAVDNGDRSVAWLYVTPEAEFDRLTRQDFERDRLKEELSFRMVNMQSMLDQISMVHGFGDFWSMKRRLEGALEAAMQTKAALISRKVR